MGKFAAMEGQAGFGVGLTTDDHLSVFSLCLLDEPDLPVVEHIRTDCTKNGSKYRSQR